MLFGKFPIFFARIYIVYHIIYAFLYFLKLFSCQVSVLTGLLQYVLPQQYETFLHRLLMFQQAGQ